MARNPQFFHSLQEAGKSCGPTGGEVQVVELDEFRIDLCDPFQKHRQHKIIPLVATQHLHSHGNLVVHAPLLRICCGGRQDRYEERSASTNAVVDVVPEGLAPTKT